MAAPMNASPAQARADHSAARASLAASRRQVSGFLKGTSRDLGTMVRDSRKAVSASGRALPGAEGGGKGMVLPFTPLNLTFHHLNYYVTLPKVNVRPITKLMLLDPVDIAWFLDSSYT